MTPDIHPLYELLPSIYRIRDAETGEPLKALLDLLADQLEVMQEDLAQLYDDQFIETCAEWVVPYLGELIGYRRVRGLATTVDEPRAEVANTMAYRRRKGTVSMLEQLATDVTGYKARAVEYFQHLCTTQYLNHLRPSHHAVADLRRQRELQWSQTPFGTLPRTVDVRWIASGRGRYNLPNVGLFLWRLQAQRVGKGMAKLVKAGCVTVHPLGFDQPMLNPGRAEARVEDLAGPVHVPEPLRRRPLYDELESARQQLADGRPHAEVLRSLTWFDPSQPACEVFKNGTAIPPEAILICDLSDWTRPPATRTYRPRGKGPGDASPDPKLPIQVAVDPVLGRIAFPAGVNVTGGSVQVTASFASAGAYGGGPYAVDSLRTPVSVRVAAAGSTLVQAMSAVGQDDAVIQIDDSATIEGDLSITLAPNQDLTIQGHEGARPVLNGTLTVIAAPEAELTLHNLMIAGGIRVTGKPTISLTLRHCTLVPVELAPDLSAKPKASPSVQWTDAGSAGRLTLERSISGRLRTGQDVSVTIVDTAVDASSDEAVALASKDGPTADDASPAGHVQLIRATVIGRIRVEAIDLIEHSLVTGLVHADQRQVGCVRCSYVPLDSLVPRRYRCQPEWAAQRAADEARFVDRVQDEEALSALYARVAGSVRPLFTTVLFGQPGYLQLHGSCSAAIRAGTEDGGELGLFHALAHSHRDANLRVRMGEYLRFGLESGLFYVT